MNDRDVFTEAQVAQIIRAASRRHGSDAGNREASGVTRSELERLAHEVGIAPADLAAAIEQVRAGEDQGGPPWRQRSFERVVEGEFPPEAYAESLLNLPIANTPGQTAAVGNTFRCNYMAGLSSQELKVVAKDGRTRVRVETTPVVASILACVLLFITTMVSGITAFDERHPLAGAIVAAIGYSLAYLSVSATAKAGARCARRVLDELVQALSHATPNEAAKTIAAPSEEGEAELAERLTQG